MVCARRAQAWLAHRILLRTLRAMGGAHPWHGADRAAGDAALWALLAYPLHQGQRCRRRPRGLARDPRGDLTASPFPINFSVGSPIAVVRVHSAFITF